MKTVEPIRDINLINNLADYLKEKNTRDYIMFVFGIYSGLRITDILNLKVKDVKNKDHINIQEQKTGKEKQFLIHPDIKKALKDFIKSKNDDDFIFRSRQGINKPITRSRAYDILYEAAKKFKISNLGTHSMRKTFGYFLYQQTKDIVIVKEIFNHSDIATTMRYIGMSQDIKDKAVKKLKIL
ncbi:MAG TPA: site-specific integrase [Clostridia bacterium]